jgi:hypothetical protein
LKVFTDALDKIFGKPPGKQLGIKEMESVATELFKIPKIFGEMLFTRLVELRGSSMTKVGNDSKLTR